MREATQYDERQVVLFERAEEYIDGIRLELTYYSTKSPIEIEGVETATYGIQIDMLNTYTDLMDVAKEVDIHPRLLEVRELMARLIRDRALPYELHDMVTDYVNDVNSLEFEFYFY